MRRSSFIALAVAVIAMATSARTVEPPLDTASIESITGLIGNFNPADNVFRISKPRTDIAPFRDLASYAAFTPMAGGTLVMGDTVLLEDEVNPAMSAALDAGLEVTALYTHFPFDPPRLFSMHIVGTGDGKRMATAIRAVYDRIDEVRAARSSPGSMFAGEISSPSGITVAPIEAVFGISAQRSAEMVKVTIGRTAWMHGVEVGNEMGINTSATFAGSDQEAVVAGDFAVIEDDLQAVLKTLRGEGINIVAIRQHMTKETPRLVFVHYWGQGKAVDLARGVKKALNAQQPNKYD